MQVVQYYCIFYSVNFVVFIKPGDFLALHGAAEYVCYVFLPCGETMQAHLLIRSLIYRVRSSALVTFYRGSFSHCLHPRSDTDSFRHTNSYKAACAPLPA